MDTNAAEPNDSRLLGLHSLYHLCRMTLLCPQVSIFSGRPQPESSPKDDAPARAQVIITHAVAQSQLVRDYLSKSGDISTISPLTGFSSFVSASTLLNAAKSWVSRTQPADDASRNGLFEVLTIISETLSLLEVLQTYWATLRPMVRRHPHIRTNYIMLTFERRLRGYVKMSRAVLSCLILFKDQKKQLAL